MQHHHWYGIDLTIACWLRPADPQARPFRYVVTAPVLPNGWVLLGETGKFLVATADRFSEIDARGSELSVAVSGASEERVTVELLAPHTLARAHMEPSTMETLKVDCSLSAAGSAQLRCTGGKCACSTMLQ